MNFEKVKYILAVVCLPCVIVNFRFGNTNLSEAKIKDYFLTSAKLIWEVIQRSRNQSLIKTISYLL